MNKTQFSPGLHKLVHHPEHIAKIQRGDVVGPIHISIWPATRCQLKCAYCCFKNREGETADAPLDLPLQSFKIAVDTLCKYGLKAMEFSGGGEPMMWAHLEDGIKYAHGAGINLSLITNGLLLPNIDPEVLRLLKWVRVSIQSAKYAERVAWDAIPSPVRASASYVVNDASRLDEVEKIQRFAANTGVPVRISPKRPCSQSDAEAVEAYVKYRPPLMFFGKTPGPPKACFMTWVRAAIDWNGNFITCASPEMTPEASAQTPKMHELCKVEDLDRWLNENRPHDMGHRCTFCNCGKDSNDYIHGVLQEVPDVDFV